MGVAAKMSRRLGILASFWSLRRDYGEDRCDRVGIFYGAGSVCSYWAAPTRSRLRLRRMARLASPKPSLRSAGEADRQPRGEAAPDGRLATGDGLAGAVPTRVDRMREVRGFAGEWRQDIHSTLAGLVFSCAMGNQPCTTLIALRELSGSFLR